METVCQTVNFFSLNNSNEIQWEYTRQNLKPTGMSGKVIDSAFMESKGQKVKCPCKCSTYISITNYLAVYIETLCPVMVTVGGPLCTQYHLLDNHQIHSDTESPQLMKFFPGQTNLIPLNFLHQLPLWWNYTGWYYRKIEIYFTWTFPPFILIDKNFLDSENAMCWNIVVSIIALWKFWM